MRKDAPPRRWPPMRGEIYWADLDPVVGHEQSGRRPFLVLSVLQMNQARASLVIGVPMTTTPHLSPLHVRLEPSSSGLERASYAMPEMIRSVSAERFSKRLGRAPFDAVVTAAERAGLLIGLGQTKH